MTDSSSPARPASPLDFIARVIVILTNRGAMEQGRLLNLLAGPGALAATTNDIAARIIDAVKTVYRPDGTPVYVLPDYYLALLDQGAIRYHQDTPDTDPIAIVDNTRLIQPAIV